MNKQRRAEIQKIIDALQGHECEIADLGDAESEAFENLPEGLQASERGEAMEQAHSLLEEATESLRELIEKLEEAME